MYLKRFYGSFFTSSKKYIVLLFDINKNPYEIKIEWDGKPSSLINAHNSFCVWFTNNWTIPWKQNKLHINIRDDEE